MYGIGKLQRFTELQQSNVIVRCHLIVERVGDDSLQFAGLHVVMAVLVPHATVGQPAGWIVVPAVVQYHGGKFDIFIYLGIK